VGNNVGHGGSYIAATCLIDDLLAECLSLFHRIGFCTD
jgi:hypothetical protein